MGGVGAIPLKPKRNKTDNKNNELEKFINEFLKKIKNSSTIKPGSIL